MQGVTELEPAWAVLYNETLSQTTITKQSTYDVSHRTADTQVMIHQCSNRTYPRVPSRPGGAGKETELPAWKQVTRWAQSSHG